MLAKISRWALKIQKLTNYTVMKCYFNKNDGKIHDVQNIKILNKDRFSNSAVPSILQPEAKEKKQ